MLDRNRATPEDLIWDAKRREVESRKAMHGYLGAAVILLIMLLLDGHPLVNLLLLGMLLAAVLGAQMYHRRILDANGEVDGIRTGQRNA